jgi:aspartate kinase
MRTLVMKFGGAAVATPQHFSLIADVIIQRKQEYPRIAIVVSAMGDTTNELIGLAKAINPFPPQREYDMLITTGERISASLLAMALAAKNHQGISFTGSQAGIITCNRHTEARILEVKPTRLVPLLNQEKIVIVAGFQGVSKEGEITTLGRGGSDTTAVALALAIHAEKVEFFKDVPGIFHCDPKIDAHAPMYSQLSYQEALNIVFAGAKILHSRCLRMADNNGLPLHIKTFNTVEEKFRGGTLIAESHKKRLFEPVYEEI